MRSIVGLIFVITLFTILAGKLNAQDRKSSIAGPLTRPSQILLAHDIDLSRPSLVRALSSTDPEIRSAAALQLGDSHDPDAISDIEAALRTESNARTRIAFAQTLWGLHDPKGVAYLQGMCGDSSLTIYSLVEVVQTLNAMGQSNSACIDPVLNYLGADNESSDRKQAVLPALSRLYRWAPKVKAERILSTLEGMLSGSQAWTRMEASHALVEIKALSSAQALRDAISHESDPVVRSTMQRNLDELERYNEK